MPLLTRHLDEDEAILPPRRSAEREMTLGTGAILGIFFGLVVLLGAFFGFGYKVGSSTTKTLAATSTGDTPASTPSPAAAASFNNFKPSAGWPAASSAPAVTVQAGTPTPLTPREGTTASHPAHQPADAAESAPAPATMAHNATPSAPAPSLPMPATTPGGAYVVQVAAVSHQEDADLLVNALHTRGYTVAAHTEPGDKLVHIQVGPFGSKKDAEAMKARLTADGYNAFIK